MPETVSIHIETIAQMHQMLDVAKPRHPLFSILRFEDFPEIEIEQRTRLITNFYQVTLKTAHPCKIQYGQNIFDFDEGIISCFAPKQVTFIDQDFRFATSGWQVSIHPDFLRLHPLGKKIKEYGFFEYAVNEALILSDEEQQSIEAIFLQIEKEYHRPIDAFSQDVIVSNIDLLLTYCNRYYNRQFITRKALSHELLISFEAILEKQIGNAAESGLPTVTDLAAQMNLSPKYLSDCLKQLTGQTTQQLIHDRIVEHAKGVLATTGLTINEIAFQLGFEQSQSFSKLFKSKTSLTPLAFRQSFH
ncbi:helix-turn-helix transcriptional regulator [Mucilaginibacter sp. Bleaf8]|uniref:helix-turn-helix domain-containing protein n=1 Tax=Mucilaginibacter sp. Bleaf8 TaxID=2834430 RepID=UPI001BCD5FE8|nr:AraC family transcriptional regulator [Mucilaginibacter sp. Bleaf8]MBS7564781.1 helix-turn-helix transcriptional regulator [Mucilaginibacter sp. Bleaf8]